MTYSVYQHWDPLKVCALGRSYPPEFYSWIQNKKVRKLFEKIAVETEEDYQNIIKTLKSFDVKIVRTCIPEETFFQGKHISPPMTPRDITTMIGKKFYYSDGGLTFSIFYNNVKDPTWPKCNSLKEFYALPQNIIDECFKVHKLQDLLDLDKIKKKLFIEQYQDILGLIQEQTNQIIPTCDTYSTIYSSGAMVSRIGRDLYFGTANYNDNIDDLKQAIDQEFPDTRNHIINTGGHGDGTYCPVAPGLIISLRDVPTYADTFPDWEVIYLPNQSWSKVKPFLDLKKVNGGKWWIPGFEYDQAVIDTVASWLDHWTGYVAETVFDVNMLIIDPKNVMIFNYNKKVFDALDRYGITAHVVPFRHRYFWDGGIHCVTCDLDREGSMQDYFPERG